MNDATSPTADAENRSHNAFARLARHRINFVCVLLLLPVGPVRFVSNSSAAPSAPSSQPTPEGILLLPNDTFLSVGNNSDEYAIALDNAIRRSDGPPTLSLRSAAAPSTSGGVAFRNIDVTPFLGKRVRFSAYIKATKPTNFAGLVLRTFDPQRRDVSTDDMRSRGITTTTDWTEVEILADIPPAASAILVGLNLHGAGQVWMDNARLEILDDTQPPATIEYRTHLFNTKGASYSLSLDSAVPRNGLPVPCITSSKRAPGPWCWYGPMTPTLETYLGQRIRVSAWIKTENVTGNCRLSVWAMNAQQKLVCIDNPATRKLIKGTNDWKKYEIIADVPPDLTHLDPGFNLYGGGKVWIDELHYDLAPDDSHL